jgi:uncharacterized hydrophobic protein (TIGR00271 family)
LQSNDIPVLNVPMLFVRNLPFEEKQQLLLEFEESGSPSRRYYTLATLAIIIATLGMILNSPATIIGAMLVAPLMQPILLAAIALVTSRLRLLSKALGATIKGTVLSIIIATFISLFTPIFDIPGEVLARSQPNILDLFIALAAGAAGMYVMVRKDSVTLPGVAISVSLMPPLSAVGIGLATRNFDIAIGASLLFLTNFVAIVSAGAFILFLFGFRPYTKTKEGILREGATISITMLTILTILLSSTFIQVSSDGRRKSQIEEELTRQIQVITSGKGRLQSFNVEDSQGKIIVSAIILSQGNLTKNDMEILTNALAWRTEESVNLQATVIPVLIGGRTLEVEEKEEIKREKIRNPELEGRAPLATGAAEPFIAIMEVSQDDATDSGEFSDTSEPEEPEEEFEISPRFRVPTLGESSESAKVKDYGSGSSTDYQKYQVRDEEL